MQMYSHYRTESRRAYFSEVCIKMGCIDFLHLHHLVLYSTRRLYSVNGPQRSFGIIDRVMLLHLVCKVFSLLFHIKARLQLPSVKLANLAKAVNFLFLLLNLFLIFHWNLSIMMYGALLLYCLILALGFPLELRYIKGTLHFGIHIKRGPLVLLAFSDSD